MHLATLSLDAEIRFASPADRAAFTRDLSQVVTELVSRYHDATAPGGRPHRLVAFSEFHALQSIDQPCRRRHIAVPFTGE
jgi:hypothetical protein